MKKYFTILAMLTVGMSAMAQDDAEPLETIYQKFSFTLFDKVVEKEDESVILSPLSAQIALSMVQNGAAGNTLSEIQQAMGTYAYTNEQVNDYNRLLTERLTYRPPFCYTPSPDQSEEKAREEYEATYPICEMANGIWTAPRFHILESYKEQMRTCYDAEVGEVDFATQEGIDSINSWVKKKTHQLIPSILNNPDSDLLTLLANALYFKGSWTSPFDTSLTQTGLFHLADGSTTEVDMMTAESIYTHTTSSDKFSTVTLPYGNKNFSMTIFLPTEEKDMPPLTYEDWLAATDSNAPMKEMMLTMPKFEIEGTYNLVDIFKSLGMEEAFSASADFRHMTDFGLSIGDIFQSGKIIVDEKGTEATAVTVVMMFTSIPSETFVINRPFYFTLEEQSTHTILFVGRMLEIGKPSHSPDCIDSIQSTPDSKHQLYDLSGRALRQVPQKGIYIQDGKKIVIN